MSVIIRLKNLPVSAGASDVRTFFSGLKIPDGAVHIIGGDEGEVFVGFASDEDARIAMTRDRSIIHGAEIRLLLSSKAEQNAVIAARKNGTYNSPKVPEDHTPPVTAQAAQNQQNWNPKPSGNPYAAKPGYEALYPPQNSNVVVRMEYNNQNSYNNRPEVSQNQLLSPTKPKETPTGDFGVYKQGFQQQGPPIPNTNRFLPAPHAPKIAETISVRPAPPVVNQLPNHMSRQLPNHPPIHPPNQIQQFPPERPFPVKGGNNSDAAIRGNNLQGPVLERPSGGDSWRDTRYNQPHRNNFKDGCKSDYKDEYPSDFKNDFTGGKYFSQVVSRNAPPSEAQIPNDSHLLLQNGRRTLMPTPAKSFQNGPPQNSNIPQNDALGIRAFQPNLPPSMNQQRNGLPPFKPGPTTLPVMPTNMGNQLPPAGQNRLAPPFQGPMGPAIAAVPMFNQPSAVPHLAAPVASGGTSSTEKFYIELTRLPNDLLRPASLEAFIRPTLPLTLSSVKTVFGPGGIHMHTIIRFDSIADYATMMRRNGEQGIKIQQSDKKTFDAAVDGVPLPVPQKQIERKRDDEDSKKSKRSRWEDKSPKRSPRRSPRSPPRRDSRDWSRSRSPPRRRRRSRSPKRREEHTDPTRWCVQVTNVPFRIKEEDLMEWFAEKVRPAKLVRTYYSDGNASDRWIAEFSSESLMHRSFSIRTLCASRQLQLSYIDNEKADEILKIADVYGEEKRNRNETARIQQEVAEKANPPSFFNAPSSMARVPNTHPNVSNGSLMHASGIQGIPNGHNLPPISPPGAFNGPPVRGGFAPRGNNGFPPPRGGIMGRGGHGGSGFYQNNRNDFNNGPEQGSFGSHGVDAFRGGFRGGYRGRGGGRGGFNGNFRSEDIQPTRNEFMDLVKSIGPRGTVLSCNGFPKDVTLEDVVEFFADYEPDRNSIRIRRGEDGIMTGECMLACFNPEDSRRAAMDLDGQRLRNSPISVHVV